VLGKIIQGTPVSATGIRKSVPAHLDAAIRKALEKLPADRFRGATDFAKALSDPGFRYGERAAARSAAGVGPWNRLAMALAATTALFALAFGWSLLRPELQVPVARFSSPFEEGQAPIVGSAFTADGSALVYVGPHASGQTGQLWIRRWADLEATPIRGTEGAVTFALSPDDREVAFAAFGGPVSSVAIEGGQPRTLVEAAVDTRWPNGAPMWLSGWGSDGMLYYYKTGVGIERVPVTGGVPETLTTDPTDRLLDVLPDGRGLLVLVVGPDGSRIGVVGPEGGEARDLFAGLGAQYARSGHVVYISEAGTLMAAPFDLKRLEPTAPSVAIFEGVLSGPIGALRWTLSDNGTLLYPTGARLRREVVEFVWVTRSGEATVAVPAYTFVAPESLPSRPTPKLSPDGGRVAFSAVAGENTDVWVMNLDDGVPTRLTFQDGFDDYPIWLNGERIAFRSGTAAAPFDPDAADQPDFQVWAKRADNAGNAAELVGGRFFARSVTPDGGTLILYREAPGSESLGRRDIFTFRPGQDSEPVPLLAAEDLQELSPALSPDGRWLAYVSDEAGQTEVFVTPFPDVGGGQWQVSTDGGMAPVWARNGGEIFYYQSSGRQMMSAEFTTSGSTFRPGQVTPLFAVGGEYEFNARDPFYDVAPDDQRFLLARTAGLEGADQGRRYILVQNFFEELKRRVPN
jgi:serine/threonine-protein kinase